MKKKKIIRQITDNALIAAIYYVLTIILGGFAFNDVQFRISEILLFLIFFRKTLSLVLHSGVCSLICIVCFNRGMLSLGRLLLY